MEERLNLKGSGLIEVSSSELVEVRGGASAILEDIFTKIKYVVNFIADYVPKFLKGFAAGFSTRIF